MRAGIDCRVVERLCVLQSLLAIAAQPITEHVHAGLGVDVAYGYSVVALLVPGLFRPAFRGMDGRIGLYFEPAAVIVALVMSGEWLELRATHRTSDAVRALFDNGWLHLFTLDRGQISARYRPGLGWQSLPGLLLAA